MPRLHAATASRFPEIQPHVCRVRSRTLQLSKLLLRVRGHLPIPRAWALSPASSIHGTGSTQYMYPIPTSACYVMMQQVHSHSFCNGIPKLPLISATGIRVPPAFHPAAVMHIFRLTHDRSLAYVCAPPPLVLRRTPNLRCCTACIQDHWPAAANEADRQ